MTAAVYRSTPSMSCPPTENTAPVFEFNCLYTHDVKKKQKKWQDGTLRFHTFNKRCMVYDLSRNFIGDCHWTGNEAVQEGDELRLERNGVMVEVGDNIGQTETDLSELRKSRKNDSSADKTIPTAPIRPTPRPVNGTAPARGNAHQKHRSLTAVLGTPKGPIGKAAMPQKSPFEDRHASAGVENEEWEDERPPKKQRMTTAPEWNVTRTVKASKPAKQAETALWARKVDAANKQKKAAAERLAAKEVITLSDDDSNVEDSRENFLPGFSDDALAPSSPVKDKRMDACKESGRSSSPAFQTQRAPPPERRSKDAVDWKAEARKRSERPSKGRLGSPDREDEHAEPLPNAAPIAPRQAVERTKPPPEPSRPASSKSVQTLRLAATAPKKPMLLCQAQVSKKLQRMSSIDSDVDIGVASGATGKSQTRLTPARKALEARLAKIDKKGGSTSSSRFQPKAVPIEVASDDTFADDMADGDDLDEGDSGRQSTHERSALELRRLDEMMLPPAAPAAPAPAPDLPRQARSPPKALSPVKAPSTPPAEPRPLRPVASESFAHETSRSKRVPGAPVRCTPTPSPNKPSRQTTPVPVAPSKQTDSATGTEKPPAPSKTFKKKPLQKSVSLNVTSNGTSTVILSKPFQAPGKAAAKAKKQVSEPPQGLGPWSREAFDLFTWRPPNWDEEKWCVKEKAPTPPAGLSGGTALPHVL